MRVRADLHTHSVCSDGSDSPTELVRKADDMNLGGLALTDHDTLDGIQEFMEANASDDLQRVPGLEISTEYENIEVHILGYFVPLDSKPLNDGLEFLRRSRHKRLPKMIRKLNDLGADITTDELYESLEGVASPGRPHVAQLLVKKGFVKTTSEAFQKYLASDRPAYVKKERMKTIELVTLLKSVGAVPVLAHPFTIKIHDLRSFIETLMDAGLLGIETEYDYSFMEIQRAPDEVSEVIQDLDILQTGGSDYHGTNHSTELGSVTVPIDIIGMLEKMHHEL